MFNPMNDNSGPTFWQQVLLVTIPAFVGACLPPVIHHYLTKDQKSPAPQPAESQGPAPGHIAKRKTRPKKK